MKKDVHTPFWAGSSTNEGIRVAWPDTLLWQDGILLLMSLAMVSISMFARSITTSPYHIAVLLGTAGVVFHANTAKGSRENRVKTRHLALFIVLLVNFHYIGLSPRPTGRIFLGRTLIDLASIMSVMLFPFWLGRNGGRKKTRFIRSSFDLTVFFLCLVIMGCFLGIYVRLYLHGLPAPVDPGMLKAVFLSAIQYYILRDTIDGYPDVVMKRILYLLLLPLAGALMWAVFSS